jgi:hypothetical protein
MVIIVQVCQWNIMYRACFQYSTHDSFFHRPLEGETSADCLLPLNRFWGLYWSSLYDRPASMMCLLASKYPAGGLLPLARAPGGTSLPAMPPPARHFPAIDCALIESREGDMPRPRQSLFLGLKATCDKIFIRSND